MSEQAGTRAYVTPTDRAHDSREHEEWFLRLPEHGKQEMRRLWRNQEGNTPARIERRRRTTQRYMIEGTALFALAFWMFFVFSWSGLFLSMSVGFAVGSLAAWLRACTYHYSWLCAVGYIALGLLYMGWLSIFPFLFCTCCGALLGVGHLLHRYDFSET